ncbi:hypothetical protein Taro_010452, partial [Colocasia esculenta]|nr:hypothetical protein [Colocasia esculenta]
VVLTLAELLWDQSKPKQKCSTKNGPQIQRPSSSRSMEDLILILNDKTWKDMDIFVCVVIHNIDGPGLQDCESQQCLAQIACCSVWDKKMVHSQFNWCWYHVPTFMPYKVEGVFFPLILASGSTMQNAKTALIVLQSLTPNAQSVFKALAEYQLAHPKEGGKYHSADKLFSTLPWSHMFFTFSGMPVNALYGMCRERFVVSSQVALNSHLVEFKDHDLVKTRRNTEGQDCYYVPLSPEALEKLLQELN